MTNGKLKGAGQEKLKKEREKKEERKRKKEDLWERCRKIGISLYRYTGYSYYLYRMFCN